MKKPLITLLKLVGPFKWWMLLAALLGFLTVGSSVGLVMTSAWLIAQAALHPSVAELQVAIVGVRFFGISRGLFRYLERLLSHHVTFKLLAKIRVWFYKKLEPLAPAGVQNYQSGDLLSRLVNEIEGLQNFYIRVLAPPLVALGVMILVLFLFSLFSWKLAFLLIIFMLLAGVGVPTITWFASRNVGKNLVRLQKELTALSVEHVQGLAEILMYGQERVFLQKFADLNKQYIKLKLHKNIIQSLHEVLIGLVMNIAVFVIFVQAIPLVQNGMLNGVSLAVLALGIMAAFEAIMPLPDAWLHLEENLKSMQRLLDIIEQKPPVKNPKDSIGIPEKIDINFDQVRFSYSKTDKPVFESLDLKINYGEKIAIVSPSGTGKTSLINMLLRFWEPESGCIKINEQPVENFSQNKLAEIFGVIPQNPYLFGGTIRQNFQMVDKWVYDKKIEQVCKIANIYDFIINLPDAYDTWIGEQGLKLSGGERQRLAIARTLLKNSPVLILDEPTANLDSVNADKIIENILKEYPDKTIILISHQKQIAAKMDRIVQLDEII